MICIGKSKPTLEEIRKMLHEAPLVALREQLTDKQILDTCAVCGYKFRNRQYGPVVTVLHFLAQAIGREGSFAATWQELWTPLIADFPEMASGHFNTSGLTHARQRLPKEVMMKLASETCAESGNKEPAKWRGFRLLALDCSTVSMPRSAELFGHFGKHRARTTTVRYPLGTFAALLAVGNSLVLDYQFGPYDPGEVKTSRPLFSRLGCGDILLIDRGHSGSPTFARIKAKGADFLARKNAHLIVSRLPVIERLGYNDFITEISMSRRARKKDAWLPERVRVRIFEAKWKSPTGEKITEWFVTSLEDARRYKKRTLANLYHQRWRIETSYLEFKQLFHADVLRSKTVDNIYKEFAAHVLAYQLVRLLVCLAAEKHDKKPTEISFLNAARWIIHFSHRMAAAPTWSLRILYERLLDAIASCEIEVRPGRVEPRAITRAKRDFPDLRISRAEWRRKRAGGNA
jgi:hypothetical protein